MQPPLNDGKKRASKDYKANAPRGGGTGELVPFHFGETSRGENLSRNKERKEKGKEMRGKIKYGTESSSLSVVKPYCNKRAMAL